jgi:hypothetical protein
MQNRISRAEKTPIDWPKATVCHCKVDTARALCQSLFGRKFPVRDPCGEWIWSGKLFHVLAAERGCPMDNSDPMQGDVPAQVALMVFVTLWGILSYSAVLSMARIWA